MIKAWMVVVVVGTLAACGSSTNSSSSPTTATVTSSATPGATASSSAPVSSSSGSGCAVVASLQPGSSYAGHSVETVVLTNNGNAACDFNGYPAVQFMGSGGPVSGLAQTNSGGQAATATPSPVSIATGHAANFVLELSDIGSGAPCPSATSANIELPNSLGSVTLTFPSPVRPCPPGFNVSAITPG